MADKLLFKFKLNEDLEKTAKLSGLALEYEVREHPTNKDSVNVWWDDERGEQYAIYKKDVVDEKIEQGFWIKISEEPNVKVFVDGELVGVSRSLKERKR